MIYIVPAKKFTKNAKKLVKAQNYLLFDATDSEDGSLSKYTNMITINDFAPPNRLVKAKSDKETISEDKLKKLEKKHFYSDKFIAPLLSIIKALIDSNSPINIFIIINKKVYDTYTKKLIKIFNKYYDVDFKFIYSWDDIEDDKDILHKSLSTKKINKLTDCHKTNIKKLTKKDK